MRSDKIKKASLTILICLFFFLSAIAQKEELSSRFYFPGLIGMGVPTGDEQTSMRPGFALNTAIEYRPTYTNAIFIRFSYDNISNNYSNFLNQIPTNVTQGKLTANFFMLGAGYRRKLNKVSLFALIQPGYNNSVYNMVFSNSRGIALRNVSNNFPAVKFSAGLEYYIVPHFALVFEPGYYHLFKTQYRYILNPNYVSYNIGFTTTLF